MNNLIKIPSTIPAPCGGFHDINQFCRGGRITYNPPGQSRSAARTALSAVEVRREAGGTTRVIVADVIPAAAREAIVAAMADADEREKVRHRLQFKNMAFQKFQSPARRGERFAALPQLFFIFDARELEATPENIESVMDWECRAQKVFFQVAVGAG